MPRMGRMLVGKFEGDYKNIKLLYNSVERYIADKHLKKVAMPYEKYLTDPHTPQDSLRMKVEVYFPIF
jgi:effector-binding domain-containing protein